MRRLRWLILALLATGCGPVIAPDPHPVAIEHGRIIRWSGGFSAGALIRWQQIAETQWHRPIVVFACHGNGDVPHPWQTAPDAGYPIMSVNQVAALLHAAYPDALVLLVVCNPGHEQIDVPGVAYPKDNVWIDPGNDIRMTWRGPLKCVGKIDEFAVNN